MTHLSGAAEAAAFFATGLSIIMGFWALAKAESGKGITRALLVFLLSEIVSWMLWLISLWHLENIYIIVGFCLQINIFLVFAWFVVLNLKNKPR